MIGDTTAASTQDLIRSAVAERYSGIGSDPCQETSISRGREWAIDLGYPESLLDDLPARAVASFTGIAAPVLQADLQEGEVVVDLGCGAGLDSILTAKAVGASGSVYGFDFAHGMVSAALQSVHEAGLETVQIAQAPAEDLPLPDESVDVVLVNGLFNLAPDKAGVASEVRRVLQRTGRLVGAEIVLTGEREPSELNLEDWFR